MATYEDALFHAQNLKQVLVNLGVTVSIELQAGRSGLWYVPKYLVMNHHTATHFPDDPGDNLTPALAIVKLGRSDVPGPLANGYGGYDFVFRIITMGLANHPGEGGPVTIDGVHVPEDSARAPTFGIEWEGGYENWPAENRKWMATVNLGITKWMKRSTASQLEHKDWAPTRKIDRVDMTRTQSITETNEVANEPTGDWFDMATVTELRTAVREALQMELTTPGDASRTAMRELAGMGVDDREDAMYYFATIEGMDGTYVVRADHTGKMHLTDALWTWMRDLHIVSEKPTNKVPLTMAVADSIPTIEH